MASPASYWNQLCKSAHQEDGFCPRTQNIILKNVISVSQVKPPLAPATFKYVSALSVPWLAGHRLEIASQSDLIECEVCLQSLVPKAMARLF